jgi:Glycosyl hydrolases family 15
MHARADAWTRERERIRDAVLTRGWSQARQAYAQSFDSDELDAAALLMPLVGFLPAHDPRMRSTIEAIARELTEDGLVLRYRNQRGLNADGLSGEEGAFVICSFWLASCLARGGEIERAQALFDRLAGCANDLGLLAEEIDAQGGRTPRELPTGLQPCRSDQCGVGHRPGAARGLEPQPDRRADGRCSRPQPSMAMITRCRSTPGGASAYDVRGGIYE